MIKKKPVPYYPGKPGPAPTGLKRERQFPLMLDGDERLYIELDALDNGKKPSPHIRKQILPPHWRQRLPALIKKYPGAANGH